MTAEEAIALLDEVLQQQHLNYVQEIVFRQCWNGKTYADIAEEAGYDTGYIKDVGSKLWKFLSNVFNEKVTKNNIQTVLRRYQQSRASIKEAQADRISQAEVTEAQISQPPVQESTPPVTAVPLSTTSSALPHCDWGDAIDVSIFYGRTEELETLTRWSVADRCRVISVLGMGGIGKTSLTIKLAQQIALTKNFQFIVWRSLRNAPTAEEMLGDWLRFLTQEPEIELPKDLNGLLNRLIQELRSSRCFLILDNAETILQGGEYSGYFRPEYEGYGELCKRIAELPHQSCLLITSRESPRSLMALEGETLPVRALRLSGISEAEAQQILKSKGAFSGSPTLWQDLTRRYGGNPLALKIVATTIQELFDGDIAAFLAEGTTVFDDIRYLLKQQFDRLSNLEQGIMYWLAVNREPMQIAALQEDLIPPVTKSKLIDAIGVLRWRSLIDKTVNQYTQQPVIMEYATERLIEQIGQEILEADLFLFIRQALIKAPAKDYVRESQIRLILQPLIDRLQQTLRNKTAIENQLNQLLQDLQADYKTAAGYAGGNLLNLFRQLGTDLTEFDFSQLSIWQAYLQDVALQSVDFSDTQIQKSVFAQTLGSILSVAFSPDGQLLASSDAEGEICLWQVADGKQLMTCKEDQNHWVWSVAFSPDNQILASSSEDKVVRLWDVNTGECLQELYGHTNWVYTVSFSPDGKQLASSSEDLTIKLWNIETGTCVNTITGHEAGVRSIVFSPDGKWLASSGSDRTVRLWQRSTGNCQQVWQKHEGIVRSIAFSPDGQWLATAGDDPWIYLWQVATGECQRQFECGHRTWSIAFSPDSQFLLTGSDDRLRLWEIYTDEPIRSFEGHTAMVLSVAFSPDGKTGVSGSDDQTIRFWEIETGRCLKTVKGHNNWVWSIDVSPNGEQIASGNEDRTVRLWQMATGRCTHLLEGHAGRVWSVAYSPNGSILASGSDDQTIKFWRLGSPESMSDRSYRCIQTLRGQTGPVRLVVFSPDGLRLASNSGDCNVKLWDVSPLYAEKIEPQGRRTAGRSGEWVSGQCTAVLTGESGRVSAIAFHPNSEQIATGNEDGSVLIWDTRSGDCLKRLEGHLKQVEAVAFHPNELIVASGSHDETVRLWDLATGDCLATIQPNLGRVLSLDFNADGSHLAIGGSSPIAALLDLQMQAIQTTLEGHTKAIQSLRFSPTHSVLVTGSEDETIRIWQLTPTATLPNSTLLRADRPYEGLNLTGSTGLTAAQKATLKLLGAIET